MQKIQKLAMGIKDSDEEEGLPESDNDILSIGSSAKNKHSSNNFQASMGVSGGSSNMITPS